jgi:alpha-L-arabinofuranosidase
MKAIIDLRNKGNKIDKNIYGHFSEHLGRCVYGGYWVGEDSTIPNVRGIRTDIVEAMKAIKAPNIRWPGGCFADDYNWMDGIGPKENRPPMINTHWGGVLENNHFGTHEFMDLCGQIGCEPYICGNVGSGTVREMRNWVEYLTDDGNSPMAQLRRKNGRDSAWGIKYFGIGNENWGCGGFMKADYYAMEFRRYATYVKNYKGMGETNWWQVPPVIKVAGGHNAEVLNWTETLMKEAARFMGALSVHCYVKPGEESNGTVFSKDSWYQTAVNTYEKEALYKQNMSIMDYYDPDKRVIMAVDEWGMWVDNEPGTNNAFLFQQNAMRSAMSAALMLHIFHKYSDRIRLANLAQTINVLQSIIMTEGARMVKTPTYHVFDLFQGHQDASFIPVSWAEKPGTIHRGLPNVDISASTTEAGRAYITIINLSADDNAGIVLNFAGSKAVKACGRLISGEVTAHNTFDAPDAVTTIAIDKVRLTEGEVVLELPACAIAAVEVELW